MGSFVKYTVICHTYTTYVTTANELVENMTELDRYVRTPKAHESYMYYEKTLESLDELVAQLA